MTNARDLNPPLRAGVLVSSDRAYSGAYEDKSGPAVAQWLEAHGIEMLVKKVVPDDRTALRVAIQELQENHSDMVIISGGTGLGPRDVTPQVLQAYADYEIPGFGELLRKESLKYSLNAYLSRCGGWVKGSTLLLAIPGNPKAAVEQLDILEDLLPHAVKSLRGQCDHRRKTTET